MLAMLGQQAQRVGLCRPCMTWAACKSVLAKVCLQRPCLIIARLPCAAITRAREAVVVVGAEAAMRTALQGTQGDVRLSSLHGRLAAAADRLNLPRSALNLMLPLEHFPHQGTAA